MCGNISEEPSTSISCNTLRGPGSHRTVCSPFVSFERIAQNGTRLARIQDFPSFQRDVAANTLPQYAHMSPDMLNDGHNTSLSFATAWIKSFLTPLLSDPAFMSKTLILLTYDESETFLTPTKIYNIADVDKRDRVVHFFGDNVAFDKKAWLEAER